MRSIGRKNMVLVRSETERAMKLLENTGASSLEIKEQVIEWLPESMFLTWEGARTEIDNMMDDTIHGR